MYLGTSFCAVTTLQSNLNEISDFITSLIHYILHFPKTNDMRNLNQLMNNTLSIAN